MSKKEDEKLDNTEKNTENNTNNNEDKINDWKLVEHRSNKGPGILKRLIIITITVGILLGMVLGGIKIYDYTQAPNDKTVQENKDNQKDENNEDNEINEGNIGTEAESGQVEISAADLKRMYNYVHFMANTIIIPGDGKIRGTKDITNETIAEALSLVENVDEYLYTEINKWKDGDFDNAVDVHNYVWEKLDGEEGRARSLNKNSIEETKARLAIE